LDADKIVRESAISSLMQLFRAQAEWGPSRTPIHTAFMHQDGEGFNVVLQALPINGKIVLRPPKTQTEEPGQQPAKTTERRANRRS